MLKNNLQRTNLPTVKKLEFRLKKYDKNKNIIDTSIKILYPFNKKENIIIIV